MFRNDIDLMTRFVMAHPSYAITSVVIAGPSAALFVWLAFAAETDDASVRFVLLGVAMVPAALGTLAFFGTTARVSSRGVRSSWPWSKAVAWPDLAEFVAVTDNSPTQIFARTVDGDDIWICNRPNMYNPAAKHQARVDALMGRLDDLQAKLS